LLIRVYYHIDMDEYQRHRNSRVGIRIRSIGDWIDQDRCRIPVMLIIWYRFIKDKSRRMFVFLTVLGTIYGCI